MHSNPSVTVIIPFKDNLEFLYSALNSVFKQTYKNYKILIIYDNENKVNLGEIKKFLNEFLNTVNDKGLNLKNQLDQDKKLFYNQFKNLYLGK